MMYRIALVAVALTSVSTAKRVFLKPHHEAFLVTGSSGGAQENDRSGIAQGINEELTLVESEARQLDANIVNAAETLAKALMLFQSLAEGVPKANHSATAEAPANKKAAPAKEAAPAKKAAPAAKLAATPKKAEAAKPAAVKAVAKEAKKVGANATANASSKKVVQNVTFVLKQEQSVLEDLMKHLKSNIATYNKEDSEGKKKSEEMVDKFEKKLKKDKEELAKKGLSDFDHARLVNQTRMDEEDLKYWSRDRELQHNMFHVNLKMAHGLMSHVKNVLAAYHEASTKGHVDAGLLKKVEAEVVTKTFLQMREDLKQNSEQYKTHLRQGLGLVW